MTGHVMGLTQVYWFQNGPAGLGFHPEIFENFSPPQTLHF